MVVKKTVKKSPMIKKVSPVIVETKKHEESGCCSSNAAKKYFGTFVIILLLLNLIIGVLNYFKTDSARDIETLKVGGRENLELVRSLYEMDIYKEQQRGAIMQVLNSFMGNDQMVQFDQFEDFEQMPEEPEQFLIE